MATETDSCEPFLPNLKKGSAVAAGFKRNPINPYASRRTSRDATSYVSRLGRAKHY